MDAPIVEVTVQEDRAMVRRRGTVSLPPGRTRVVVPGVAAVLVDKSLTVRVADPHTTVAVARAKRRRVVAQADKPEAAAELTAQQRRQQAQLDDCVRRQRAIESEHTRVLALYGQRLAELAEDAGHDHADIERATADLSVWQQRLAGLAEQIGAVEAERREAVRGLEDLAQLQAATATLDATIRADLQIDLDRGGEGTAPVEVEIEYLVPGALWRPWHRAQLLAADDQQGARVRIQCEGCVWQATGEDWTHAQIVLSTERPSLGRTPPLLATDELALRRRDSAVQVDTREQQVHHASVEGAPPAAKSEPELPGIDDGGEPQRLGSDGPVTIAANGRAHRVPLFEFTTPAEVGLVCTPELAPAVILRTVQTHTGRAPLLAGPVDLIRQSGLVGRTSVLFVGPGESFELGWGPDPALRVEREVEWLEHERKALRSWTTKPRRVTIKLSNLDAAPRDLTVRERITVSEIDKVRVELSSAEPPATADKDGFVQWAVHLPGLGRRQIRLRWALTVHDDVQGV